MGLQSKIQESQQWLNEVNSEIRKFGKTQKYYKLKSEYHRIMYKLSLEQETLEKAIALLQNNNNNAA